MFRCHGHIMLVEVVPNVICGQLLPNMWPIGSVVSIELLPLLLPILLRSSTQLHIAKLALAFVEHVKIPSNGNKTTGGINSDRLFCPLFCCRNTNCMNTQLYGGESSFCQSTGSGVERQQGTHSKKAFFLFIFFCWRCCYSYGALL